MGLIEITCRKLFHSTQFKMLKRGNLFDSGSTLLSIDINEILLNCERLKRAQRMTEPNKRSCGEIVCVSRGKKFWREINKYNSNRSFQV